MEESKTRTLIEGTIVDVSQFEQKTPNYEGNERMYKGFQYVSWNNVADEKFPKSNIFVSCLFGTKVLHNCYMDSFYDWYHEIDYDEDEQIDTPDAWSYQ